MRLISQTTLISAYHGSYPSLLHPSTFVLPLSNLRRTSQDTFLIVARLIQVIQSPRDFAGTAVNDNLSELSVCHSLIENPAKISWCTLLISPTPALLMTGYHSLQPRFSPHGSYRLLAHMRVHLNPSTLTSLATRRTTVFLATGARRWISGKR